MSDRISDSAGGERPRRDEGPRRQRRSGDATYEPVGRRPEEAAAAGELGLGGEGAWSPDRVMEPVGDEAPPLMLDPERATDGPRPVPTRSTAEPMPKVGVQATAGRRQERRDCPGCGYNLRGIDLDGRCPECGLPVGDAAPARDVPLSEASPGVIRSVAIGITVCCAAIIMAWAGSLFGLVGLVPREWVAWALLLAAGGWVGGLFVLTGTHGDPIARFNGMEPGDVWRRLARSTSPLILGLPGLGVATWIGSRLAAGPWAPSSGLLLMAGLAFAVSAVIGLGILHRMATWVRDERAERLILAAQWTLPFFVVFLLLTNGGWSSSLGPPTRWWSVSLALIFHATFALAAASLAAAALQCLTHARERLDRNVRRAERREAGREAMEARIDQAHGE